MAEMQTCPDDRWLRAAHQIAESEEHRSMRHAYHGANLARLGRISLRSRKEIIATHLAFADTVEGNFTPDNRLAIAEIFADTLTLPNATLNRVRMDGKWDRADEFDNDTQMFAEVLTDRGYRVEDIKRGVPESELTHTIMPNLTSLHGLIAISRRRRLLVATRSIQVRRENGKRRRVTEQVELNKIASFAANIDTLEGYSAAAAREVRLIAVTDLLAQCNITLVGRFFDLMKEYQDCGLEEPAQLAWRTMLTTGAQNAQLPRALADIASVRRKMKNNNFDVEEILARSREHHFVRLSGKVSIQALDTAIDTRERGVLTPASTTLWTGRSIPELEDEMLRAQQELAAGKSRRRVRRRANRQYSLSAKYDN